MKVKHFALLVLKSAILKKKTGHMGKIYKYIAIYKNQTAGTEVFCMCELHEFWERVKGGAVIG